MLWIGTKPLPCLRWACHVTLSLWNPCLVSCRGWASSGPLLTFSTFENHTASQSSPWTDSQSVEHHAFPHSSDTIATKSVYTVSPNYMGSVLIFLTTNQIQVTLKGHRTYAEKMKLYLHLKTKLCSTLVSLDVNNSLPISIRNKKKRKKDKKKKTGKEKFWQTTDILVQQRQEGRLEEALISQLKNCFRF